LPARSTLPNAHCSTLDVANQRIWRMVRRVIKEGGAINASSPPEDLHELRKSCKKLRYLMEFFQSLYPADEIQHLIKALKFLQNQLGEYQDVHVQIASLATFRTQMKFESGVTDRTLVQLILFYRRSNNAKARYAKSLRHALATFAENKNRAAFRRLFKPKIQKEAHSHEDHCLLQH